VKPITFIARAAAPTLPAWLVFHQDEACRIRHVGMAGGGHRGRIQRIPRIVVAARSFPPPPTPEPAKALSRKETHVAALHPMLNIAVKAARAAGSIINRAALDLERAEGRHQGPNDFVTEVDQAAEAGHHRDLLEAYPGHGILAEESGREHGAKHSELRLDHRSAGRHHQLPARLPVYAVSIALATAARCSRPWSTTPRATTCSTPRKGRGAFLNDRRLRVSKRTGWPTR
jgi:hypothetical protein